MYGMPESRPATATGTLTKPPRVKLTLVRPPQRPKNSANEAQHPKPNPRTFKACVLRSKTFALPVGLITPELYPGYAMDPHQCRVGPLECRLTDRRADQCTPDARQAAASGQPRPLKIGVICPLTRRPSDDCHVPAARFHCLHENRQLRHLIHRGPQPPHKHHTGTAIANERQRNAL